MSGAAQRVPGIAAAAQAAGTATQDMGLKMLNAAQNIAQMTDFEAQGAKANAATTGSADGPLGEAMYNRFRKFDTKYLQPVFGKGDAARESAELDESGHERSGDRQNGSDDHTH